MYRIDALRYKARCNISSMRALVTGGGGFIGSALASELLENGHDVRVLENFITGERDQIPDGSELIEADLRDRDAVIAASRGIDVVFHQGAIRSVPRSVDQPDLVTECNVIGTLNVLIGAAASGVRRVVYASSSSVYGDVQEGLQHEDAAPNPVSPYAASKLAAEYYCRVWAQLYGVSTISLRYFNVFGPGQQPDSRYAAVFPGFVMALSERRSPEVHWDGQQARDFTYVDDVVAANLAAASADLRTDGAVINIGGGDPKTVNEVLRAVSDVLGVWIEPTLLPKRAGDIRRTHADISRAKAILGWEPRADWKAAVTLTARGIRRKLMNTQHA